MSWMVSLSETAGAAAVRKPRSSTSRLVRIVTAESVRLSVSVSPAIRSIDSGALRRSSPVRCRFPAATSAGEEASTGFGSILRS